MQIAPTWWDDAQPVDALPARCPPVANQRPRPPFSLRPRTSLVAADAAYDHSQPARAWILSWMDSSCADRLLQQTTHSCCPLLLAPFHLSLVAWSLVQPRCAACGGGGLRARSRAQGDLMGRFSRSPSPSLFRPLRHLSSLVRPRQSSLTKPPAKDRTETRATQ